MKLLRLKLLSIKSIKNNVNLKKNLKKRISFLFIFWLLPIRNKLKGALVCSVRISITRSKNTFLIKKSKLKFERSNSECEQRRCISYLKFLFEEELLVKFVFVYQKVTLQFSRDDAGNALSRKKDAECLNMAFVKSSLECLSRAFVKSSLECLNLDFVKSFLKYLNMDFVKSFLEYVSQYGFCKIISMYGWSSQCGFCKIISRTS